MSPLPKSELADGPISHDHPLQVELLVFIYQRNGSTLESETCTLSMNMDLMRKKSSGLVNSVGYPSNTMLALIWVDSATVNESTSEPRNFTGSLVHSGTDTYPALHKCHHYHVKDNSFIVIIRVLPASNDIRMEAYRQPTLFSAISPSM